jgi:hypothetical protein
MSTKPTPSTSSPDAVPDDGMQGEGNHAAGRRYNEATERFVQDDLVDNAAAAAAPTSREEAEEMEQAEEEGRRHARH